MLRTNVSVSFQLEINNVIMAGFGSGTHLHQNVIMLNAVMVAQLTW